MPGARGRDNQRCREKRSDHGVHQPVGKEWVEDDCQPIDRHDDAIDNFAATALESDGAFSVRLASTGQSYAIARDKSVLEVLTAAGVDVPFSCESGICGSCLTRVLEGVPDHRDSFLTDSERAANDQFTPCCSRARSERLVLDL